jgi:hypothetical protein
MARPRPDKPEKKAPPPAEPRVLPMQLKVSDRIVDKTGEYEVIGQPHTSLGRKSVHVRVERVEQPRSLEIKTWGAQERISVKRATAEKGKR